MRLGYWLIINLVENKRKRKQKTNVANSLFRCPILLLLWHPMLYHGFLLIENYTCESVALN